jgi:hypothetical protein
MPANVEVRRRSLRLLRSDPLPPLPDADDLLNAEIPRRPGELHEVLVLSAEAANRIAERAAKASLAVDVAASLVLEAGLLSVRLPQIHQLNDEPDEAWLAQPEASARYLRSLTVGRRSGQISTRPSRNVAIPVRLVPRLGAVDVEQLIDVVTLERAIAWEIAAVRAGQTMSEWLLEQLLLNG